jgi:hypothetical protein
MSGWTPDCAVVLSEVALKSKLMLHGNIFRAGGPVMRYGWANNPGGYYDDDQGLSGEAVH